MRTCTSALQKLLCANALVRQHSVTGTKLQRPGKHAKTSKAQRETLTAWSTQAWYRRLHNNAHQDHSVDARVTGKQGNAPQGGFPMSPHAVHSLLPSRRVAQVSGVDRLVQGGPSVQHGAPSAPQGGWHPAVVGLSPSSHPPATRTYTGLVDPSRSQ